MLPAAAAEGAASIPVATQEDNAPFQSAEEGGEDGTEVEGDGAESEDGTFVELESGAGGSNSSWLHSLPSGPSEPSARNLAPPLGSPSRQRGGSSVGEAGRGWIGFLLLPHAKSCLIARLLASCGL